MQTFQIEGLADTELDDFQPRCYQTETEAWQDEIEGTFFDLFGSVIQQAIYDYQHPPKKIKTTDSPATSTRKKNQWKDYDNARTWLFEYGDCSMARQFHQRGIDNVSIAYIRRMAEDKTWLTQAIRDRFKKRSYK